MLWLCIQCQVNKLKLYIEDIRSIIFLVQLFFLKFKDVLLLLCYCCVWFFLQKKVSGVLRNHEHSLSEINFK